MDKNARLNAAVMRSRVQPVLALLQYANTSSKGLNEESQRLLAELARSKRKVSRFWLEKCLVAVDTLQIFGLMWQLSQIWPWPSRWLAATRWTLVFGLDFLSLTHTGAGMGQDNPPFSHWGEMKGYWVYALAYACLPYLALGFYAALSAHWTRQGDVRFLVKMAKLQNALLALFQLLYLPIGVAVSRLWHCQDAVNPLDTSQILSTMSVDPSFACHGTAHVLVVTIIAGGLGLPFLVGFPMLLYRRIMVVGAFDAPECHETFLQGKELGFLLNTSDDYHILHVGLYASFTRRMMTRPVLVCVVKLILLVIFALGRSRYPSITMQPYQGVLFCMVVILDVSYRVLLAQPYRCRTTAQLCFLLDILLCFNAIMGTTMHFQLCPHDISVLLSSNPIKSALTVDSVKLALFGFVHTFVIVLVCVHVVGTYLKKRAKQVNWPTHIHMRAITRHVPQVTEWVAALHAANRALQKTFVSPTQIKPTEELESVVAELHRCANDAAKLDHLMHAQLHETSLVMQALYIDSLGTSVLAAERIQDCVRDFTSELDHYKQKHGALQPHKRNALFKLAVFQTWNHQRPGGHDTDDRVPLTEHPPAADPVAASNVFESVNVLASIDAQLNLRLPRVKAIAALLHSIPPLGAAVAPVHWHVLVSLMTNDDASVATSVVVTTVQCSSDRWLKVKVPLARDNNVWVVLDGWLPLDAPPPLVVKLLACHDPDSRNLFQELYAGAAAYQSPPPVAPDEMAQLIEATRSALGELDTVDTKVNQPELLLGQWTRVIQQWNVRFLLQHQRCATDADKAKIRIWYSLYHALAAATQS
ncbi:Aste57867_3994 [Aphanomyces stellatus]|uniref:Aste57867_3994 protein n=1 Tax=Aphanomyces stellatus TaxID=120398 RepID=A0A485KEN5_9STRA|nr:hypothetical protein As57867_003983 [Aphanomyces stellatus]VFT81129.1 Aste57867_3994 [Aphanomyces stellatus]